MEFLVDGADEDLAPEPLDGAGGLALLAEPVQHGDGIEIPARVALQLNGEQRAADGELVGEGEEFQAGEALRKVERFGEDAGAHDGGAAAGLDEVELFVKVDLAGDTEPAIEVEEIDAALEQDVLAVVDDCAGIVTRCGIGRGAAAQEGSSLQDRNTMSGGAQCRGGGQPGESAAEHENVGHLRFDRHTASLAAAAVGVPVHGQPAADDQKQDVDGVGKFHV